MRRSASSTASSPGNSARTRTEPRHGEGPATHAALYVHTPFCKVKCGYCDFNSFARTPDSPVAAFLDAFERELQLLPGRIAPRTIFIGGGTPTLLTEAELARLLDAIRRRIDESQLSEFTTEANPESVTRDKAELLRSHGVNRVSVGAQTFDPERLRFLDRPHGPEAIGAAVATLRAAGFANLSIDLIFGLPGQTLAAWDQDLELALALNTEHLSCYNLTFEPGTALHSAMQRGQIAANDEELDRELFLHTRARLLAAGFQAYEVSNFARSGHACQHNVNYWRGGDYFGLGPGAASHRAGVRSTNVRPVTTYNRHLSHGLPATDTAETLTPRQRLAEAAWLGLRLEEGISLPELTRRFGLDATAQLTRPLDRHRQQGLLAVAPDGRVTLTSPGLLLADAVAGDLLETGRVEAA